MNGWQGWPGRALGGRGHRWIFDNWNADFSRAWYIGCALGLQPREEISIISVRSKLLEKRVQVPPL